jgi:hypothetical protein
MPATSTALKLQFANAWSGAQPSPLRNRRPSPGHEAFRARMDEFLATHELLSCFQRHTGSATRRRSRSWQHAQPLLRYTVPFSLGGNPAIVTVPAPPAACRLVAARNRDEALVAIGGSTRHSQK